LDRFNLPSVERMTGVSVTKITYWLTEFPELRELALEEDEEVFLTYEALGLVLRLELLLDEVGLTIAGARRQLALDKAPEPERQKLSQRILSIRRELEQVRQILED